MTRQQRFDVRVAPEVVRVVRGRVAPVHMPRQFRHAMNRLASNGTRATGCRKLSGLDLWEIRVGDYRAYFVVVPALRAIAVGALVEKKARRHRFDQLRSIESRVHRWRDDLEETR